MKGTVKWFNAEKAMDSSQVKTERMYLFTSPLFRAKDSRHWTKARVLRMI